jgi:hypothetical protein
MSKGTPAELPDLGHLPLREKPIGDSALIENLDGAGVQTTRARAGQVLAGAPLDNDNVHARQHQLARQHQPGRTTSSDHHLMLGHSHTPIRTAQLRLSVGSGLGRRFCGTPRVLPQDPSAL